MGTPLLNQRYKISTSFANRGASTISSWASTQRSHTEGLTATAELNSTAGSLVAASATPARSSFGGAGTRMSEVSMLSVMSSSIPTFSESSVGHFQDWRKSNAQQTRVEVQRMRERLRRLDEWQSKSMDDVLTPEDVANAKKNLTALKRNTSGFLRAQARKTAKAKAKEEETSATASKNLLHAAAEGKLEDCRRLITDQRRQLEYLRIVAYGGERPVATPEGLPAGFATASATPGGLAAAQRASHQSDEYACAKLVNSVDESGRSALHHAACHGHPDVAQLLLSEGAEINLADPSGFSALHFACRWGRVDFVDFIVWAPGLDINAKDQWGQTALHVVSTCGHHNMVHVLVARGADMHARNVDGESPLQVAKDEEVAMALNWALGGPDGRGAAHKEAGHNEAGEYVSRDDASAAERQEVAKGEGPVRADEVALDGEFGALALMEAVRDEFDLHELGDAQVADIMSQYERTAESEARGEPSNYSRFVHDFGHKYNLLRAHGV